MIIYIHGFGGSGQGSKAKLFREYFKSIEEDFIAPSLSYVPELAIATLQELIESYRGEVYLIGSSLGGFYATHLSQMPEVKKVVLLNPAVYPYKTLTRALGEAPNFYDESFYSWKQEHIEMLQNYKIDEDLALAKFMLMVQKGDELLDYKEAVQKYEGAKQIVQDSGNHGFEGIESHFETIREFFALGNHFKHTSCVKGVGLSNVALANRVGDLYYDDMAAFLEALSSKINSDAQADKERGRVKLFEALKESAEHLYISASAINRAWGICKMPTLKWMLQNGFNKAISFGVLENMIFHEFANRSRWDNASMSDEVTRTKIANYDDDFTQELLAPFDDKGRAYIEFLKTYLKVIADGDFYPEHIPDEYEFIKQKCKEFHFEESFRMHYL